MEDRITPCVYLEMTNLPAADYAGDSATLEVTDDDVPLVLNLAVADASVSEGAGAAATTATVTRSPRRAKASNSFSKPSFSAKKPVSPARCRGSIPCGPVAKLNDTTTHH